MSDSIEQIKELKKKYEFQWLQLPKVIAVGLSRDEDGGYSIVVTVTELTEQIRKAIPEKIDGVPVRFKLSDEIRAL